VRLPGLFSSGGTAGFVPSSPVTPITISFAWVGNVVEDGATIKLRSANADSVALRYSTDPDLIGFATEFGSEGADEVWTVDLTGLAADTRYYFGFAGSALTGTFKTWPTEGTAHSFLIVASGDTGLSADYAGVASDVANPPTWDRMLEHEPLICIVLGDFHYRNLNTSSQAAYRNAYQDVLAASHVKDFVRQVPTCYVWDDHDYGPNDSDGTYSHKDVAQAVYREYVPAWPLAEADAIYHSFVIGRVRFINIDSRSDRSPNSDTDNSSKSRLGTTQKQWLKDTLDAATEPCIVLNVMSWIGNTTAFDDGWESFSTERTELFDYFSANGHMDRLFLIGADIHELMSDDGSNTNFETGASTDGPPYAGFAPIDATLNDFSATAQTKFQTRKQQYGTLEFSDTGTQITVTAKGYALSASPGSTSVEKFSLEKVFTG
jgi:phosphodiesterase/alkaline phosphatase D-like protein